MSHAIRPLARPDGRSKHRTPTRMPSEPPRMHTWRSSDCPALLGLPGDHRAAGWPDRKQAKDGGAGVRPDAPVRSASLHQVDSNEPRAMEVQGTGGVVKMNEVVEGADRVREPSFAHAGGRASRAAYHVSHRPRCAASCPESTRRFEPSGSTKLMWVAGLSAAMAAAAAGPTRSLSLRPGGVTFPVIAAFTDSTDQVPHAGDGVDLSVVAEQDDHRHSKGRARRRSTVSR